MESSNNCNRYKKMDQKIKISAVIGIDPGAKGGLAVFIPGNTVKAVKMPKDLMDLRDFFAYYAETYKPIIFLEKLTVRPDDITPDASGKANMGKLYRIQKMMANFEHLKALIETAGIPYCMCHPLVWQNKLNLRIKGVKEEKAERKRRYAKRAAELYPGTKVTLWNSDAILIAHFGRYILVNEPSWVKANLPVREHDKLF